MKKHNIPQLQLSDLTKCAHVTRWHSVRTLRDQTLSEHHFVVSRIASNLAKNIVPGIDIESLYYLNEYAMLHDAPEILLGDINSRCKHYLSQIVGDAENPLDVLEEQVAPWLPVLKKKLKPELLHIVKIADLYDALLFISVEGLGKHAESVVELLKKMISDKLKQCKKEFPDYKWNYAEDVLNNLMENGEETKIKFEGI